MRIYVLTHDERIFHPSFFHSVLSCKPPSSEIVGAAIVNRVRSETTAASLKHLYPVGGVAGILGVAGRLAWQRLQAQHTSIRSVFEASGIPVREIVSPNQPEFVDWLKSQKLDIVYSSITNMLKLPILGVPRLGCVNRHSGKLPDYRGAEPVFHALRRRDPSVTVTFHSMVEQLDGGNVLWEHTEPVTAGDSVFGLYARLYRVAATGFWPAMAALESGGLRAVDLSAGAVYKRPTSLEIAEFRRTGRRYI